MGLLLPILFIGIPIAEIAVFAWVGGQIGVLGTIAMVVACAFAGTTLLRWQGVATLARAQASLAEGRLPSKELADGLVILVAAVLLITPGFVTDAVGLLLLFPGVRGLIRRFLVARLAARVQAGNVVMFGNFGPSGRGGPGPVGFGRPQAPPDAGRPASETEVVDRDP